VLVSGGDEAWTLLLQSPAVSHEQVILGVKPDTSYEVTVTVANEYDEQVASSLQWRTPALPSDFPRLEFIQSDTSRMEPGMTLFDVRSLHYVIVVDGTGEVRWYYHLDRTCETVRLLANGNLIYVSQPDRICEIDWLGNSVACWVAANAADAPAGAIAVDVEVFHHSVHEMPSGNILALSREHRDIEDYPSSVTDANAPTRTARVGGDVVTEFTRDGQIVKAISLLDLLDPTRVGYNAVSDGQNQDWSHSNSAVYDPDADAYLVSARHQDAVLKIDRETESLLWILGNHANWDTPWQDRLLTPVGEELEWQYHQHSAQIPPGGGVGLHDNGNYGAPAFEPRQSRPSRAVRYSIDEDQMTVTQVWSYTPVWEGEPLFSGGTSDADWQPTTGNVLITSGTLATNTEPPGWAQIVEVTDDGTVVFELHMLDSPPSLPVSVRTAYLTFDTCRMSAPTDRRQGGRASGF
jgi:arylsulfate sulfotransferase